MVKKNNGGPDISPAPVILRPTVATSLPLLLVGSESLIVNAWSEKALDMIRDKHMGEARNHG